MAVLEAVAGIMESRIYGFTELRNYGTTELRIYGTTDRAKPAQGSQLVAFLPFSTL